MIKKIGFKKFFGFLLLLVALNAIVFGISLTFNSINISLSKFDINFSGSGNSFLGTMLISKIIDLTGTDIQIINLSGESRTCTKQILGYYFNSQRGNRLRPLDQSGLDQLKEISTSYNNLTRLSGGLFTNCIGYDKSSIFGYVEHKWGGIDYYIVAGTKMDYDNNKFISSFADSFQRFDVNQGIILLGFIWDNYGGIGLVGGPSRIGSSGLRNLISFLNNGGIIVSGSNNPRSIKSGFTYSNNNLISTQTGLGGWSFDEETLRFGGTNLFWNMFVKGNVGLSKSYQDVNSLSTTTQNESLVFNLSDVNVSSLVNTARKNSSILCRDKWTGGSVLVASNSDVLCYRNTNLNIDLYVDKDLYEKKTIILNSGNIILSNSMNISSSPFELFIDKGNLYLNNPILISNLQTFDQNGYPNNSANNFKSFFLKGAFVINGLIIGSGSNGGIFPHKFVVHGKITSLNSVEPSEKRKQQVEDLLGNGYRDLIDLSETFIWNCSIGGTGSDGTSCGGGSGVVSRGFVIIDNLDKGMKYKLLNY